MLINIMTVYMLCYVEKINALLLLLLIAPVLQFCGSMNDGHDDICNMELLIIFFDCASTGLGHSLDCCRLNGHNCLHVMIIIIMTFYLFCLFY